MNSTKRPLALLVCGTLFMTLSAAAATLPTGSILINNGAASTATADVTLNLSATDTGGTGLLSMRFRNSDAEPYSAWEPYLTTKSWSLSSGLGTKKVYAQFMDGLGNISDANPTAAGAQGYQDSIVLTLSDTAPPTGSILINSGAATTSSAAVTLNLLATDSGGSGLASMRFRGSDAEPYGPWESFQATRAWVLSSEPGTKKVSVQFMDGAGNISDANPNAAGAQGYADTIVFTLSDTTPPTGSILINNGAASTDTAAVILNLSATDTGGSGLVSMRFRNTDAEPYGAWEPYQTTRNWTLAGGSGTRKVSVQFTDGAGNISDANPNAAGAQGYADTIVLSLSDTAPPTGSILINNGDASTSATAVTLNLSATDTGGSGLVSMRFRNGTVDPYGAWEPYQDTRAWELTSELGTKEVYVQFMDGAGNISDADPVAADAQGYQDSIVLEEPEWTVPGDLANCPACHGTPPHVGKDGLPGTADDAPNVMTYWSGSNRSLQDGGHGDDDRDGSPPLVCVDCHDISLPAAPSSAKHGTGTYNSIWANDSTRSTNTSHLKADFFTKYPANGAGDWSVQVAFDRYCNWECHDLNRNDVWDSTPAEPTSAMWHSQIHPEFGESSSDFNYRSVEFGTHLTMSAVLADAIGDIPIDEDLSTDAAGGKAYAPCISCHDPHGTGTIKQAARPSNFMLRFSVPSTSNILCSKCHI